MAKRKPDAGPKTRSCCYCGLPTTVARNATNEPLKRWSHAPYPTEIPPLCVEIQKGWAITRRIRRESAA